MQIVETANEGLKRGYTVTISAKDIYRNRFVLAVPSSPSAMSPVMGP